MKANSQSGVEDGALELAQAFMKAHGGLGRKCYKRGELSHLYLSTFKSWAASDVQEDPSKQRPFKQVLFAMAHGMKVVRVVDRGRKLLWNRYRDNEGKQIERSDHQRYERRKHRAHREHRDPRYERRDQDRSMSPEHRSYNGDRNDSRYSHGKRHHSQSNRRCYNCDKVGHIGRDCDQPDRRESQRKTRYRRAPPSPKSPNCAKQTVDLSNLMNQGC